MKNIGCVSIIIPVYKVEKYINQCINSVLKQTYSNLEIILVDDGSPDNCGVICDEYAKKDKRIKVIHKQNGGLSDARNAGIDISTGEYIFFLDSDDYINSETIELLAEDIYMHDAEIAVTSIDNIKNNHHKYIFSAEEYIYFIFCEMQLGWEACGKLIKRSVFGDIRFPEGKLYEDLFSVPEIILNAKRCSYRNDGLYHYTIRDDSIMGKSCIKIGSELVEAVENNENLFKKIFDKKKYSGFKTFSLHFIVSKYYSIENDFDKNTLFCDAAERFIKKNIHHYILANPRNIKCIIKFLIKCMQRWQKRLLSKQKFLML